MIIAKIFESSELFQEGIEYMINRSKIVAIASGRRLIQNTETGQWE